MFDLRSLAALRIALASISLVDLLLRARFFEEHYLDSGAVPRSLLLEEFWNPAWWSLHFYSGTSPGMVLLFLCHALVLVSLLVGYRPRAMSLLAYLFSVSLLNRNPLLLDAGDRLLTIMLLWGIFLPWGERFTLFPDSGKDRNSDRIFCWGGVAYLTQIVVMYLAAACWKYDPAWLSDGTAVALALNLDAFRGPLGEPLLAFPAFLQLMSRSVFVIEVLAPLCLLLPRDWVRDLGVGLLASLHLGIALVLDLGIFPFISLCALVGLLSTSFWDRVLKVSCQAPARNYPERRLERVSVGVLLTLMLVWNGWALARPDDPAPDVLQNSASFLRLVQGWNLFAPSPRRDDSWFAARAVTTDGEVFNLLPGLDIETLEKPKNAANTYPSQKHRMHFTVLEYYAKQSLRHQYLQFLKQTWERRNPGRTISRLELLLFKEITNDDLSAGPVSHTVLVEIHE